MKRTWAGDVRNVSLLMASAVNTEDYREILGICEGTEEDKSGWSAFLRHLVDRGPPGVQLVISDACRGLVESIADYRPESRWQRCMVHFFRKVFGHVPSTKVREVSHMLKVIHAQESRQTAKEKTDAVIAELRRQRPIRTAKLNRGKHRRDADLLRLPRQPLAQDADQQPVGTHHQGHTARYRSGTRRCARLKELAARYRRYGYLRLHVLLAGEGLVVNAKRTWRSPPNSAASIRSVRRSSIEESIGETLTCYAFPDSHWRKMRTNNPLERIIKDIRRGIAAGRGAARA